MHDWLEAGAKEEDIEDCLELAKALSEQKKEDLAVNQCFNSVLIY